jgi:hypothetical protein
VTVPVTPVVLSNAAQGNDAAAGASGSRRRGWSECPAVGILAAAGVRRPEGVYGNLEDPG